MMWHNPPVPFSKLADTLAGLGTPSAQLPPQTSAPETTTYTPGAVPYAELHCHSSYSFLDGASNPDALVAEALRLGLTGLAITDHDGFYGAVRFAEAAAASPLLTIYGAELSLPTGHLLLLARGASGYNAIAQAITTANLHPQATKGHPYYVLDDIAAATRDQVLVLTGCRKGTVRTALSTSADLALAELSKLTDMFGPDNVAVELYDDGQPLALRHNRILTELASACKLPTVGTGIVHHATPADAPLATAMAATKARQSLQAHNPWLPTARRHLRSGAEQLRRFSRWPSAVTRSATLANELQFSLREASPQLPDVAVPPGHTPMSWLRHLVWQRLPDYYDATDPAVIDRITQELQVIEYKNFPGYFLIVFDMVQYATKRGILCQGRGSAANCAICYVLGITAVDSIGYNLPFARFLSELRDEAPDIDVDFDAGRREEVIQYIYAKYGRANAAQVANVITYRGKSAVRDMAKALGASPDNPKLAGLTTAISKLPRHLGIHSGGMVLTKDPVGSVVPIEPARKHGRTVLQWDKEDCAWMGLVKFDMLSLGMLSAIQHMFDAISSFTGETWSLQSIPKEEPAVYDMLCLADVIGVFQIESRAQIGMLPRLQPRCYYDLVIEIALVRPGPIQGNAVHPFIQRRTGRRNNPDFPIDYLHPKLKPVLERTLGVPLFQEQLMQMAQAVGDCSAADADLLRRAMGSKRGIERIDSLREKLYTGMARNGISRPIADKIYAEIEAFANFGFAESHSLAFAVLVYASSWLKLHYPAAFLLGLLSAQPMGFYSPNTLIADATRHGVTVLPPDLLLSAATSQLVNKASADQRDAGTSNPPTGMSECLRSYPTPIGKFERNHHFDTASHRRDTAAAVRLGLSSVRGISHNLAAQIVAERDSHGDFASARDLVRRTGCSQAQLEALAASGALESLGKTRRESLWDAAISSDENPNQLPDTTVTVQMPLLPSLEPADKLAYDIWSLGLSTADHPLAHIRQHLDEMGVIRLNACAQVATGTRVKVAGIVTHRQRPHTAAGITFINLEDETAMLNVICSSGFWAKFKPVLAGASALIFRGILEVSPEKVTNLIADQATPIALPAHLRSRDFR